MSTGCVSPRGRVVPAVGEHIIAEEALAGGGVGVGVDESADGGVVVAGLEVIEPGFGVVDIAAVAQGIDLCQGAGGGQDLAVGIVRVGRYYLLIAVQDRQNIALEISDKIVGGAIIGQGVGVTAFVVEEVQGVAAAPFSRQVAKAKDGLLSYSTVANNFITSSGISPHP